MTASAPMSPEMSLIQQSCDHATARIRFFRIAFGTATDVRPIAVAEARKTLADHYAGTRISAEWHVVRDLGRDATQLAYLCALCLEATLPQGGLLRVDLRDGTLVVTACASVLRDDPLLWCLLTDEGGAAVQNISPATVQFALLGRICRDRDVTPQRALSENETTLRLPLPLPPS